MPETPRETAETVVARLMDELDATAVELPDGSTLRMPLRSWGIASYPLDGKTAKALVANADPRPSARNRAANPEPPVQRAAHGPRRVPAASPAAATMARRQPACGS